MRESEAATARHYGRGGLEAAVLEGLAALGKDLERLTPEDLAPLDEFHMGGRRATEELTGLLGLGPGADVLDIGAGLGGPARLMAQRHGCRVTGVDLTPEYVALARRLTRLTGLADLVAFAEGSAIALPFEEARFDAATLFHVGMNIEDKAALAREARRVLKPGGVFLVYDVMRTGEGTLDYPVAWAQTPAVSFLATPTAYREALAAAGFTVTAELERRALALEIFAQMRARLATAGPRPLGLHLLMGEDAKAKVANLVAALERGVIAPVAMLARA